MTDRKGTISVETNDIFPIIKKWLYSEHDIFLRELIANATDAISKRSTIARSKNIELPEAKIEVTVNKNNKTVTISDNGLGMTEEEVEKYIAQLAFSGAEEFAKKMETDGGDKTDIIGKFGLGFYSSFMVSSKVEIDSLSMHEGSKPVHWSCDGETEYTFSDSKKEEVGTTITLHINDDSKDFLKLDKVRSTVANHCDFMPYPISLIDPEAKPEEKKEDDTEEIKEPKVDIINDTIPLWKKDPKTLKDDDYIQFFHKLFPMEQAPLFWIHLKVDHPFTLEGILYFPKINPNKPFNESNIRLYCKQVFVSDNVKNIIPDFLSLLKGAIDSSDIPLNVSRSSLQGDPNIKRISNYIIKKVAESLKKLHTKDREKYEKIWEDVGLFVKYGIISDTKFDELMRDRVIFKNSEDKFNTLSEYRETIPADYKEKMENKVLYFEKINSDWSLRKQLLDEKIQAIEVDDHIDPHFMQHVEAKKQGDNDYKFSAVDSEIGNLLSTENTTDEDIKIKDMFKNILVGEEETSDKKEEEAAPNFNDKMEIEIGKLVNAQGPAYFKTDEQMKRFSRMAKSMGQNSAFPVKKTLVINTNNPLIKNAFNIWEKGEKKELAEKICKHVEDLATISSEGLKENEKDQFVARSQDLIQELSQFIK